MVGVYIINDSGFWGKKREKKKKERKKKRRKKYAEKLHQSISGWVQYIVPRPLTNRIARVYQKQPT